MTFVEGQRVWYTPAACKCTIRNITPDGKFAIVYLDGDILQATRIENLDELQLCGHPMSAVGGKGMTHWCRMCAEQLQDAVDRNSEELKEIE